MIPSASEWQGSERWHQLRICPWRLDKGVTCTQVTILLSSSVLFLKLICTLYICVTWTKIISTGARLNLSVSSCHQDLADLGAW